MFEDLAKQYSEDESTKAKGGDLGWILRGQTEPAFENAAFSLAVGSVSDLVKSDVGFEIIKLVQREKARTRTLDEVRATILTEVTEQKASQAAADLSDRIGQALRQNTRRSLEDLAKEFGLRLGQAPAAGVQEPVGEFGMVPELSSALFALRPGELAGPVRAGFSHVVLSLKDVVPAHQGTLAEVRSTVLLDYRREKAGELAKVRAEELAARAKSPANLAAVAKPLKLEVKTSEPTNVSGTLPEIGSLRPLSAAFSLAAGQAGPATAVGANWIVYRVVSREGPKPEDVTREMREAESQALQAKRQVAVAAFQEALRERMVREGKLRFNPENLRRLTGPSLP
jgi:peptidyl-prolyl cis-trans isomerase D